MFKRNDSVLETLILNKKDFEEPGLHRISNHKDGGKPEPKVNIIFVHGLMGHPITTWHRDNKCNKDCFPFWFEDEQELSDLSILSFGYEAARSSWEGTGNAMSIYEQASYLLYCLENYAEEYGIGKRPLIFVTHSLGGLVVKEMLRTANSKPGKEVIIEQTKGIVFLGTPHQGSHLANIFSRLNIFTQATVLVRQLKTQNNDTYLTQLNDWFADNFIKLNLGVIVFYETQPVVRIKALRIGKVVERESAKLNIGNVENIPVPADHFKIAQPKNKETEVYRGVKRFIKACLKNYSDQAKEGNFEQSLNP